MQKSSILGIDHHRRTIGIDNLIVRPYILSSFLCEGWPLALWSRFSHPIDRNCLISPHFVTGLALIAVGALFSVMMAGPHLAF